MGYVAPPRIGTQAFERWLADRRRFNNIALIVMLLGLLGFAYVVICMDQLASSPIERPSEKGLNAVSDIERGQHDDDGQS